MKTVSPGRQRGVALVALLAVAMLAVSWIILSRLNAASSASTAARRMSNAEVLNQAKQALIGYVAKEVLDLSENIPGRLPCPESPSDAGTDNEGRAGSTCDPTFLININIGRLPWRTLGLDKIVDDATEPLWYAVSPNWVLGSATPIINSGSSGQLNVDGIGNVVAIIIAPGRPLSLNPNANQIAAGCTARNQVRSDRSHVSTSLNNPNYRDYLECQNASSPIDVTFGTSVVDNATNLVLNDQVVYVTAADILNAIQGPVSERLQRTVAPLLSEFSDPGPGAPRWVAVGSRFLPYAFPFTPPENNAAKQAHCGPSPAAQQAEGLLPVAPTALASSGLPCSSAWTSINVSGTGVKNLGCTSSPSDDKVTCQYSYYVLTFLGLLLGPGSASVSATIQASAPHASASFRNPLAASDITVVPAAGTTKTFTLTPQTNGAANLSVQLQTSGSNLCNDALIGGLLCNLLGPLLATPNTVTVTFPSLLDAVVQGTQLSANVLALSPPPYSLLNPSPIPPQPPHYWFIQNEWYRYTYYAIAPAVTAAASLPCTNPGDSGCIVVSGFPLANGTTNDKRFVLALMGPAVTGQTRGTTAAMNQYVEGQNAVTTGSPRTFAYQVYAVPGNDRLAACPFSVGSPAVSVCN
jgi:hypothetical protein